MANRYFINFIIMLGYELQIFILCFNYNTSD